MSQNPAKKSFFSRPFKIFLFIALPLLAVAGVLTWAVNNGIPEECRRTDQSGVGLLICNRLYPVEHSEGWDVVDVDVPEADNNLGTDHDSSIAWLDIQVTNHTDKDYFVPFHTQKELASFAQWATSADANDKVSICVKDKAVSDTTDIEGGEIINGKYEYSAEVDGCGVEEPKKICTVTELRGQRCAAKAGVTDWEVITQKPSAGASL